MKKLALAPTERSLWGGRIFSSDDDHDRRLEAYGTMKTILADHGIECCTPDQCGDEAPEALILFRFDLQFRELLNHLRKWPDCPIVLLAFEEPPVCGLHEASIMPQLDVDIVLTWRDDVLDQNRIFKVNIPQPSYRPKDNPIAFSRRTLVSAIFANKDSSHPKALYKARRDAVGGLAKAGVDIDLFGFGWDKYPDSFIRSLWRGTVENKADVMEQYRFSVCFENSEGYSGNITEKIFDCFHARTIPIYLGASNIEQHIPPECYIDYRNFESTEDLATYLQSITEEEFNDYLAAIGSFMRHEYTERFSGEALAATVLDKLPMLVEDKKQRYPGSYCLRAIIVCMGCFLKRPSKRNLSPLFHVLKSVLL